MMASQVEDVSLLIASSCTALQKSAEGYCWHHSTCSKLHGQASGGGAGWLGGGGEGRVGMLERKIRHGVSD